MHSTQVTVVLASIIAVAASILSRPIHPNYIPEFDNMGTVDGKTYFTESSSRNWTASKSLCQSNGMKLAKITNKAQGSFLNSVFISLNLHGWYWVAAQFNRKTKRYEWVETGESATIFKTIDTSSWDLGDDNNDCLVSNPAGGEYIERTCHYDHFTLCERELSNEIESTPKPESELTQYCSRDGKAYFGDKIKRNWSDASSYCKSKGLQLAIVDIDDRRQSSFFKNNCKNAIHDGWFWVAGEELTEVWASHGCHLEFESCPSFYAPHPMFPRRPCANDHFILCEGVESIGLVKNAIHVNPDEKPVEKVAGTSTKFYYGDEIRRIFALMPVEQKVKFMNILIFVEMMRTYKPTGSSAVEADYWPSSEISTEMEATPAASDSCDEIFC